MTILNNTNLFIHGIKAKEPTSCPILDSTASIQINDDLIKIYQSRIDALINQLGKDIILNFDPMITVCPNCYFDSIKNRSNGLYKAGGPIPFQKGRKCPYCKGHGALETPVQKCIKCLIKWNPRDAVNYGISIQDRKDTVRFKTYLTHFHDIARAKTAIANYAIMNTTKLIVRLVRGPIMVGLRESRYCISFWELIND